jgi:hypothetical protein
MRELREARRSAMSGEMDLKTLLRNMEPVKHGEYAFCVLDDATYKGLTFRPLATFQEEEGFTVILPQVDADKLCLPYSYVGTLITLNVHSSLNAVGFLAKITAKLAGSGMSLNAFSPVYHDHIFVRPEDAERAMELLKELSREAL